MLGLRCASLNGCAVRFALGAACKHGEMYTTLRSFKRHFFARILIAIAKQRGFFFYARPGDDTLYCDGRCDDLHEGTVFCGFLEGYHMEIVEILQERALRLNGFNSFVDSVTSGSIISSHKTKRVRKDENR
jgi:hypothetical protein